MDQAHDALVFLRDLAVAAAGPIVQVGAEPKQAQHQPGHQSKNRPLKMTLSDVEREMSAHHKHHTPGKTAG